MKIYPQTFPWKHWVIDDFIKQHDIVKLQAIAHQHIQEKNVKSHFIPEHLDKWGKQSLQTAIDQMPMIIKDLDHVSPRKHKKLYALGHLAVNTAGYSFKPHCDDEIKVWTFVTYIGPEKSVGTFLMSDINENDKVEIPWKLGRCLVFAGNNNETWHSYESGPNWRSTITAYLTTDPNWGK